MSSRPGSSSHGRHDTVTGRAFRILAIGDIVGRPGRQFVRDRMHALIAEKQIDFVVANGENAAGGTGITPEIYDELLAGGVDVVTTGDHVWRNKEIVPAIDKCPRLLRAANFPAGTPGRGFGVFDSKGGVPVGVANILGRVFLDPVDCPFKAIEAAVTEMSRKTRVIVVDIHAEATSEKIAMGWLLDGRVSLVFGTHTHVQTADETVRPKGTAYITDVGFTGAHDSVLGRRKEIVIQAFQTLMPAKFELAQDDVRICGVLVTVDPLSGMAGSVERIVVAQSTPGKV
jgi:metallophosphoesterase (TIGR00282 family)